MNEMRKLISLMEGVMAVPGLDEDESDMQTAGTVGRDQAYAAFDQAQPQVTEDSGNTDDILYCITSAWNDISKMDTDAISPEGKMTLQHMYDSFRSALLDGDMEAFEQAWDNAGRRNVDAFDFFAEEIFAKAGLDHNGTYEDFIAKCLSKNEGVYEKAPPGMEKTVKDIKKEYPGHPEKAFATAWSIYNKKHGKTDEAQVDTCRQSNPASADRACAMEDGVGSPDGLNKWQKDAIATLYLHKLGKTSFRDKARQETVDSALAGGLVSSKQVPHLKAYLDWYDEDEMMEDTTNGSIKVHDLRGLSGSEAYARTQTNDSIKDGDILICDGGVAVMYKAWPVVVVGDCDEFHYMAPEYTWDDFEDGAYKKSAMMARQIAQEQGLGEDTNPVSEKFDLNNGYDSEEYAYGNDFFPNGADSPVVKATGPSGARQGDNPEQKKMQVAELHKELVYGYRKYLKEGK